MVQFKPGDRVVFYNPEEDEPPMGATVVDGNIIRNYGGDRIQVRYDNTANVRITIRGHILCPVVKYITLERVFYSKLHRMLS